MVCVCPVTVSQVYALFCVDFEMYCCVIFPSSSMHIFAYFLRQLMDGVCKPQSSGVLLWQCCSLSMEHSIQIGRREDCIGSDALCSLQAYLHRSRSAFPCSAFWFSAVFMSLSSLQPIKLYRPLCQPRLFDLSMFIPILFRGLFRRLYFIFHPPPGVPKSK